MRGRAEAQGALSPLAALVVRYNPQLRERVVTARRLQPSPPASLRVTVVNELASPPRGRARRRLDAAEPPAPARAKRGRSAAEEDGAPKRRRSKSGRRGSAHHSPPPLAAEAFGPQLPCPARVLAEAGVLLAAQHARRRVDFAAAANTLRPSGELRLRLTRYESAPARGDALEVLFSRAQRHPWRGRVARCVGREAVAVVEDGTDASEGVQPEAVTVVFSADAQAQRIHASAERHARTSVAPGFATAHLQTRVAAAQPARRPPLPAACTDGLNAEQAALVLDVAAGAPVTLAHGPPGTGKTRTVAAVAAALAAGGETVLVLAQQNVAALNVLRALRAAGCDGARLLVSAAYYVEWHAHEYEPQLWPWMHVPGALEDAVGPDVPPPSPAPAAAPRIVLCTFGMLPSLASDRAGGPAEALVRGSAVTAVCVDEAGAAWAGLSYALDEACPALRRLHLFGDDRQLPPSLGGTRDGGAMGGAGGPRVASLYDAACAAGHSAHALRTQYRLPPAVASFLSRHVYDGAVTSAPCDAHAAAAAGVVWHDVADGVAAQRFGSFYNVAEVHAAVAVMDAIDAACGGDGGARVALTPYREQRDALEAAAGCRARAHGGPWDVKTVDAMQGREARHVVLSLVRVPTATGGGAGFLRDARRANVALSRCAGQLAVVGHHAAWAAEAHPAALLRALARQTPPTLPQAATAG